MLFVDLIKVTDSLEHATTIDRAGYELQYVYHNSRKKYVVLPVLDFETDTAVVRDEKSRSLLEQLATDSRQLLRAHNLNIQERQLAEPEWFLVVPKDSLHGSNLDSLLAHDPMMKFYSASINAADTKDIQLGPFQDYEVATAARDQVSNYVRCDCLVIKKRSPRKRR